MRVGKTDDRVWIQGIEVEDLNRRGGSTIDSSTFLTGRTNTRADCRHSALVLNLYETRSQSPFSMPGNDIGRTEGRILLRYGMRVMCFSMCIGYWARTLSSAVGIPFEI